MVGLSIGHDHPEHISRPDLVGSMGLAPRRIPKDPKATGQLKATLCAKAVCYRVTNYARCYPEEIRRRIAQPGHFLAFPEATNVGFGHKG